MSAVTKHHVLVHIFPFSGEERCKLQLSLYIQNKTLVTYDMFTAQKQEGIPDSVIWQSYYIPQKVPLCKGLAE